MKDMFRLDFSRGTVDKIDSNIPPRGWQGTAADPDREKPLRDSFDAPGTPPGANQDKD